MEEARGLFNAQQEIVLVQNYHQQGENLSVMTRCSHREYTTPDINMSQSHMETNVFYHSQNRFPMMFPIFELPQEEAVGEPMATSSSKSGFVISGNNKMNRKIRNPTNIDNWLESMGFYRKNVAYDETCLFRAVSEQIFDCQIHHEKVRKECIQFGRENVFELCHLSSSLEDFLDHLELLEKHMVVCGDIEIHLIALKYKRDVMIFDPVNRQMYKVTNYNFEDKALYLCLMGEDHYDVIFRKEHIQDAGFCQSIVYNILYENVFGVPDVKDTVEKMLYSKDYCGTEVNNVDGFVPLNIAPFPFKIAKALDPNIYRNIEYDTWTEIRREMRLGEWYYGDDNLILGTRCIFNDIDTEETYECYIQEIIKSENQCVVYITKLAEKRIVNYSDLSPEDDAKPWPLPYRFSKNLVIAGNPSPNNERRTPTKKRNKDKKRTTRNEGSPNQERAISSDDLYSYTGVPLIIKPPTRENTIPVTSTAAAAAAVEPITTNAELNVSEHNLLVTPEVQTPLPKFQWDAPPPHWNPFDTPGTSQVVWQQPPPTTPPQFSLPPLIASAPPTPNYFGPYYNNNNNCCGCTPTTSCWQTCVQVSDTEPTGEDIRREEVEQAIEEQKPPTPESQVAVAMPSYSRPALQIFPPVAGPVTPLPMPMNPSTPLFYTAGSLPPTPMPVYTPPFEMQYVNVSPAAYVYPPTPPAAWYPPGVNNHGFIFPPPFNRN